MDVEFLTTTRIGEKGQLTVPKEYRDALELEPGAPVAVIRVGNGLLLVPEHARFRALCDRIEGAFSANGVSEADLVATLPEARARVYARLYPDLAAENPPVKRGRRAR